MEALSTERGTEPKHTTAWLRWWFVLTGNAHTCICSLIAEGWILTVDKLYVCVCVAVYTCIVCGVYMGSCLIWWVQSKHHACVMLVYYFIWGHYQCIVESVCWGSVVYTFWAVSSKPMCCQAGIPAFQQRKQRSQRVWEIDRLKTQWGDN